MDSNHTLPGLPFFKPGSVVIRLLIQALVCVGISLGLAIAGLFAWQWQAVSKPKVNELERLWSQGHSRFHRWSSFFERAKGPPKRRIRQANKRSGLKVRPCGRSREQVVYDKMGGALLQMGQQPKGVFQPHFLVFRVLLENGPPRAVCLRAGQIRDSRRLVAVVVISTSILLGLLIFISPLVLRLRRIEQAVASLAEGHLQTPIHVEGRDIVGRLADGLRAMTTRLRSLFDARKRFSDAASHELRTPLARLAAALDLMEQRPDAGLVSGMRADVQELNELVDEMLLLSRLEDPQRRGQGQAVDLLALVQERAHASSRGGRLLPQISGESTSIMVVGDRRLLARLIDNLLNNAQRFAQEHIRLNLRREAGVVVLLLSDDGPGVRKDLVGRLFDPFVSGGGGSGLGLAIAQEIARVHDGDLQYRGDASGGASFRLQLPIQ